MQTWVWISCKRCRGLSLRSWSSSELLGTKHFLCLSEGCGVPFLYGLISLSLSVSVFSHRQICLSFFSLSPTRNKSFVLFYLLSLSTDFCDSTLARLPVLIPDYLVIARESSAHVTSERNNKMLEDSRPNSQKKRERERWDSCEVRVVWICCFTREKNGSQQSLFQMNVIEPSFSSRSWTGFGFFHAIPAGVNQQPPVHQFRNQCTSSGWGRSSHFGDEPKHIQVGHFYFPLPLPRVFHPSSLPQSFPLLPTYLLPS